MTVLRDIQLQYFLAEFCLLLLFLLWVQDVAKGNSCHLCLLTHTQSIHKLGMKIDTQTQAYIYLLFPRTTQKTHSLAPSVCLATSPVLVQQSDSPVLQRNSSASPSNAVRPPPIRVSYHNSEQFKPSRYWFVDCARCGSIRISQSYKAQGLLIHDLLRKISSESRLYLQHTAARL